MISVNAVALSGAFGAVKFARTHPTGAIVRLAGPARARYITRMSAVTLVLLVIFMVTTLGILLTGIVGMMVGGEFNRKYANKLMRARVLCQFLALVFFALFLLSSRG